MTQHSSKRLIVIGAGPGGLTAGLEATRRGWQVTVLEADSQVGGLAKTVVHDGNAFDIGGHRFFTKFPQVEAWWNSVMGPEGFIEVPRSSRIYYGGKFFRYPLRAGDALRQLGVWRALHILASYAYARLRPRRPEQTFEDWITNRFGRQLYLRFFRSYTEKVWGIPCAELSADWAAQRIKSFSLAAAIRQSLFGQETTQLTTLIDHFRYPRRGPGELWGRVQHLITQAGGSVRTLHRVQQVVCNASGGFSVVAATGNSTASYEADAIISTLALPDLLAYLSPKPPADILLAASRLTYRDFASVLMVVNRTQLFSDNWIYIHDPGVRASRLQNYNNWSAAMVRQPNTTCLGMEYHCQRGDDVWERSDDSLITLAKQELATLGFARPQEISSAWVIREPRAYPRYTDNYAEHVRTIATYLATIPGLLTVGRNGMHKYNNQDHSMLTAMLAVDNLAGAAHDLWAVNADDEYHEIKLTKDTAPRSAT